MTHRSVLARFFEPVPTRRLVVVRALTFGYAAAWLVVRAAYIADVAALPERRFEPIGLLAALPFAPPRSAVLLVWVVTLATCSAAALNRRVSITGPVGAVGMLLVATYTSSFGQVFHTEHLLVLHLAVLGAAAILEPATGPMTSGWPLRLMMAVVAVAYVVAGIAKLRYGGLGWITGDTLRSWVAVDNLRKLLFDDLHSPLGGWLSTIGWIWPPVAAATILVELGAPLALIPGRIRRTWVAAAWAFHLGILVLMAISFPYRLLGVAYAAFLPVERALDHRRVVDLGTFLRTSSARRSRERRDVEGWPNSVTAVREDGEA